jgi:hypothetical protein
MSSAWFELLGPDPDEEEHVGGDSTEIVVKEASGGDSTRRQDERL